MEKLIIDIAREIGREECVFMLDEVETQVESHWIYLIWFSINNEFHNPLGSWNMLVKSYCLIVVLSFMKLVVNILEQFIIVITKALPPGVTSASEIPSIQQKVTDITGQKLQDIITIYFIIVFLYISQFHSLQILILRNQFHFCLYFYLNLIRRIPNITDHYIIYI